MTAPLLQLTSIIKSFGAVRALKGVSFDLRAGAPGQPAGLPDGSRRSQRGADLRSNAPTRRHPGGVPDRPNSSEPAPDFDTFWHPSGMHSVSSSQTGGLHSIPTSGYRLAILRIASELNPHPVKPLTPYGLHLLQSPLPLGLLDKGAASVHPGLETALPRKLGGTIRRRGGEPLKIGGVEDHVHALIGLKTTHCLADFSRELKKATSVWAKAQHDLDFEWQEGYAVFSVSPSALEKVALYIERQEEHHRTTSFLDELQLLLERHGVDYDPKYLV